MSGVLGLLIGGRCGDEDGAGIQYFVVECFCGEAFLVCIGALCGGADEDDVVAFFAPFGVEEVGGLGVPGGEFDVACVVYPFACGGVFGGLVDADGDVTPDGFIARFDGADGGGVFGDGADDC